jgi:hypothetical protein
MLRQSDPDSARELLQFAQQDVQDRWKHYEALAHTAAAAAAAAKGEQK